MTAPAAIDRCYRSADEVERLVARFEDCSLPHAEWTHRAHLTVALWYASRLEPGQALDRMREGILRLNAAHGVPTTPRRGYHETITRLYMHVVGRYAAEEPRDDGWACRANRLVERYGARDLPRRHYSEERIRSPEARAGWVEPDLLPLP